MKYQRGSLESTMLAAIKQAKKSNKDQFVFATAYGYTISTAMLHNQDFYAVSPSGRVDLCETGFTGTCFEVVKATQVNYSITN